MYLYIASGSKRWDLTVKEWSRVITAFDEGRAFQRHANTARRLLGSDLNLTLTSLRVTDLMPLKIPHPDDSRRGYSPKYVFERVIWYMRDALSDALEMACMGSPEYPMKTKNGPFTRHVTKVSPKTFAPVCLRCGIEDPVAALSIEDFLDEFEQEKNEAFWNDER